MFYVVNLIAKFGDQLRVYKFCEFVDALDTNIRLKLTPRSNQSIL